MAQRQRGFVLIAIGIAGFTIIIILEAVAGAQSQNYSVYGLYGLIALLSIVGFGGYLNYTDPRNCINCGHVHARATPDRAAPPGEPDPPCNASIGYRSRRLCECMDYEPKNPLAVQ